MKFSRLLVSGFMLGGLLQAQSEKDLIREVQRDVAQLQNQIRQSKDAQDQKNAELEALLKQTLDANSKLVASLGALQQTMTSAVAAQQDKLVQPITSMSTRVDQMSQSFGALQTTMDELTRRLARNDEKLTEILNNVKTLSAPPAAPPPSAAGPGAGTTAGASADVAFQAAERDFRSGQNQLAMDEFRAFIAQFPTSAENAPKAQYYMGVIYDRGQQYEDSVKAYDAVLERYQENPITRDALYGKAVALMKLDRNVEAKKEFTAFIAKYPTDDKVAQARQYLRELSSPARPPLNNGKKRTK
ncbi:MAG: Tetratricopeptide 2 repeat protein [Bryobacterales bacterium]|nr:Tetratricopeptide 2 repeat protein [Bryobacterales bacterium]